MSKLTAKQQRFCDEYIISLNAKDAAIKAGYSKKTAKFIGAENLTKPNLKNYIDGRMSEKESELIASQDEVLQFLTSGMRGELDEEVVIVEGRGDGASEARTLKKKVAAKEQVKCAELLGKRYGVFTDKVNIGSDLELNVKVDYGDQSTSE